MSIYINKRQINFYGEKELNKMLSSNNLKYLLLNRLYRNQPNRDIRTKELSQIDAVEDYLVDLLMNYPNKINNNMLLLYKDLIWNIFCTNPEIAYDSKLFVKEVAMRFFSNEQLKKIIEYKTRTTVKIKQELMTTFNRPNRTISNEALRVALYQIKTGNIDVKTENLCEKLYNYILNNISANNNIWAKEFIIFYTSAMTALKLNIPIPYNYLSKYNMNNEPHKQNNYASNYGNYGIIEYNKNHILKNFTNDKEIPPIVFFLFLASHETRHSYQANNAIKGNISNVSFEYIRQSIFRKYLSKANYEEYNKNYVHSEIEKDANEYGWHNAYEIVMKRVSNYAKCLPLISDNERTANYNATTATKIDSERKSFSIETYNVNQLNKIVLANPNLILEYPILRYLYNMNGKLKDIFELIKTEKNSFNKVELKKIFKEYYIEFINNGTIKKYNPQYLSEENQLLLFQKLAELCEEEIENLIKSITMYDQYLDNIEFRKKEFSYVNTERVKRIKELLNYLEKYSVITKKLLTINEKNNRNRKELFKSLRESLFSLNKKTIELNKYLNKLNLLGINSSSAYRDIKSLGEVIYNGQAIKNKR